MSDRLLDHVTEAIHRALPSPRKDKWIPLTGFSWEYQSSLKKQAEAAIKAVREWDEQDAKGKSE